MLMAVMYASEEDPMLAQPLYTPDTASARAPCTASQCSGFYVGWLSSGPPPALLPNTLTWGVHLYIRHDESL